MLHGWKEKCSCCIWRFAFFWMFGCWQHFMAQILTEAESPARPAVGSYYNQNSAAVKMQLWCHGVATFLVHVEIRYMTLSQDFLTPKLMLGNAESSTLPKCILFLCSSVLSHGQIALLKLKKSQSLLHPVTPCNVMMPHPHLLCIPKSSRTDGDMHVMEAPFFFCLRDSHSEAIWNMKHQTLQP